MPKNDLLQDLHSYKISNRGAVFGLAVWGTESDAQVLSGNAWVGLPAPAPDSGFPLTQKLRGSSSGWVQAMHI